MREQFTDSVRKAMQLANQEAQRFNHEYIGTEHILLGLLGVGCCPASYILWKQRIEPTKVRNEIERIVLPGPDISFMGVLPKTPRAVKVLEFAIERAKADESLRVGTEHLLFGLLRDQENVAAQVLLNLGMDLDAVARLMERRSWQSAEPSWLVWNDAVVPKIARQIWEEHRWHELPILADALEEAGCTDAEILQHCRQPGDHGASCWVLDLLLFQ